MTRPFSWRPFLYLAKNSTCEDDWLSSALGYSTTSEAVSSLYVSRSWVSPHLNPACPRACDTLDIWCFRLQCLSTSPDLAR